MRSLALSMLGLFAAAGTAAASTFGISPIRIELDAAHRTAILTVRSQDDAPVVVQAQARAWTQPGGQDQLGDTRDLLVTPPLFTLAPRGEQILRIALLRTPDDARELDYRVVLAEVPPATPLDAPGLRVALRLTLPAFVAARARTAPDLTWRHGWLPDGTLAIDATNRGSAHIQIKDFDVLSDEHAAPLHVSDARYVLPGSTVEWRLPSGSALPRAPRLNLHGRSDDGDFTVASDSGAP